MVCPMHVIAILRQLLRWDSMTAAWSYKDQRYALREMLSETVKIPPKVNGKVHTYATEPNKSVR